MNVDDRIDLVTRALQDLSTRGPYGRDGNVVMEIGLEFGRMFTFPTPGDARAFVGLVEHVPGLLADARSMRDAIKQLLDQVRRSSDDEILRLRAENAMLRRDLESVNGAIGRGIAAIEASLEPGS